MGVTIYQLLTHLRTWYKIMSTQKLVIKACSQSPWSKTQTPKS